MKKVAIGGGQGFWGDSPDAATSAASPSSIALSIPPDTGLCRSFSPVIAMRPVPFPVQILFPDVCRHGWRHHVVDGSSGGNRLPDLRGGHLQCRCIHAADRFPVLRPVACDPLDYLSVQRRVRFPADVDRPA